MSNIKIENSFCVTSIYQLAGYETGFHHHQPQPVKMKSTVLQAMLSLFQN